METNILKRIFFDQHQHWEKFKNKYGRKIRPIVIKEVEKFRDYGDIRKGFKLFVCLACREKEEIPLSLVRDFDLMDEWRPNHSTYVFTRKMWWSNVSGVLQRSTWHKVQTIGYSLT